MSSEYPQLAETLIPTRTAGTEIAYLKRGQALTASACRMFPNLDVLEALLAKFGDASWVLQPATARVYKAAISSFLVLQVEEGRCDAASTTDAMRMIEQQLAARRGRPEPRTSRRKQKYATTEQVEAIIADLSRRRSKNRSDPFDAILKQLFEVVPYVGLRPCEWTSAVIKGRTLVVRNAKHTNGRGAGSHRFISLERMPGNLVKKLAHLIALVRRFLKEGHTWSKVLKKVSERLARICERLNFPRLSLYSLRHTAIATWKRAKLDRVQIAAMSGHASILTASRHYAPAKRGWKPESNCVIAHQYSIVAVQMERGKRRFIAMPRAIPDFGPAIGLSP